MGSPVRLQKHLARAGIASRRGAEEVIREGRVQVNGKVVRELGTRVDPERDEVRLDGRRIEIAPVLWIALHKPAGYVTTRRDPQRRSTIYDLLPGEHRKLFTVGRLDAESEGLLLLTNDGDTANRLLHPRYGYERVYQAEVEGTVGDPALRRLQSGVRLEDGLARARMARRLGPARDPSRIEIVMAEGRKREVRRLLAAVGHPVVRLRRIRFGPISLGRLPVGRWRRLSARETHQLETARPAGLAAAPARPKRATRKG
jgi:23S rRNA pseudouridine2605 synthase